MSDRVSHDIRITPRRRLLPCALALQAALLAPAFAQVGQPYPARVLTINGQCEAELRPSKAVISGGVAVSALKPSTAADQLEKEMKLIRAYVQRSGGKLIELERVRIIHTEGSVNGQPRDPSFQLAQRIRAEFPADSSLDEVLEHLIELGLDRFGDNMSAAESRQSIVVVRYEIEDFDQQLKQIRDRCTVEAWKTWCASEASQSLSCKGANQPESLQLQSLTLHSSEKVLHGEGPTDYYRINLTNFQPSQLPSPPELLGNLTLHLTGNITLNNSLPETK